MFDYRLISELKTVIGWDDYQDATVIAPFGSPLHDSDTSEYYQDYHAAMSLENILSCLPPHSTNTDQQRIEAYCAKVETQALTQMLNDVADKKKIKAIGHELANSIVVFNADRKKATLTNQSYFCGVMFKVQNSEGMRAVINRVGLFLTAAVTNLDLYLFNSTKEDVIEKFQFTAGVANSFSWKTITRNLDFDDGTVTGGTWYFGYYQDDLAAKASAAISYTAMNWMEGYCNQCGLQGADIAYKSIRNRLFMKGFYVQSANLPANNDKLFDVTTVIESNSDNFGFNFHISIKCDLTQFWIDNKRTLKNAMGLSVALMVLKMMKNSQTINSLEENLKIMIVRDLEGAADTNSVPLWLQRVKAINALNYDEGNLKSECFPCARKPTTVYKPIG